MKILQIHNRYLQYGGEDKVVDTEMRLLREHGLEVQQLIFDNAAVRPAQLFHNKAAYAQVISDIFEFKPDVVHVHNIFYKASPSVLKAAKDAGVPVIMTLHNFRLLCTGALFLRDGKACTKCKDLLFPVYGIKNKCYQNSYSKSAVLSAFIGWQKIVHSWHKHVDRFVVLTPFIKDLMGDSSLKLPIEKIVVKPNSTDDASQLPGASGKRNGYLFIGRLSEEKGAQVMIEAFNSIPELSLTIIGEGKLESQLKSTSGDNITFIGHQDQEFVIRKLKENKALIFPSICFEGLPNTVMEAFSSETPVIASDIDNINQIITDGINGLLFEAGNSEHLAQVIREFDKKDATALQRGARKTFETRYTHEDNFNKMYSIYQSVI